MIGSLTSGVQAMSSFVKGIEVIGNNISNINTVGFKGATTRFQDAFSNTLKRGTGNTGLGSNSVTQQIGTGSKIATIKTQFSQGSLQTTGGLSDLGVSGEGFFRVRDTLQGLEYATRAGDFRVDDQGYLVTNSGFRVQGIGLAADEIDSDANGVPDGKFTVGSRLDYANLRDIRIDFRSDDPNAPRMESYQIDQGGNVNIFLSDGTSMVRGKVLLQRFNDTGALVKEGDNLYSGIADAGPTETWPASRAPGVLSAQIDPALPAVLTVPAGAIVSADMANHTITLAPNSLVADAYVGGTIEITGSGGGTYLVAANTTDTLTLQAYREDPADWAAFRPDATSAFTVNDATTGNVLATAVAGAVASSTLTSPYVINLNGTPLTANALIGATITITGNGAGTYRVVSNTNNSITLAAETDNPASWHADNPPDNTSSFSINRAPSSFRSLAAAQNGNGRVISGSIEMSNIDLTNEFANMITTQRAFQAASKLITTSDEILQDIVNLKR